MLLLQPVKKINLNGKILYDIDEIIKAEEEARVSHEARQT